MSIRVSQDVVSEFRDREGENVVITQFSSRYLLIEESFWSVLAMLQHKALASDG